MLSVRPVQWLGCIPTVGYLHQIHSGCGMVILYPSAPVIPSEKVYTDLKKNEPKDSLSLGVWSHRDHHLLLTRWCPPSYKLVYNPH